jgi:hypothetical protein
MPLSATPTERKTFGLCVVARVIFVRSRPQRKIRRRGAHCFGGLWPCVHDLPSWAVAAGRYAIPAEDGDRGMA